LTFYNKVILIGDLAKGPDTRYTPSGVQVTRFALRFESEQGGGETRRLQTVEVVALGRLSKSGKIPLSEGCRVLVEGRIQTRTWKTMEGQKRERLEIIAEKVCPLNDQRP